MSSISSARFISLDTALLGNIARDRYSKDVAKRSRALSFMKSLISLGLVPLLSWHHIEELLKHESIEVATNRFDFIRSLPLVAWIGVHDGSEGVGSIVDIHAHEIVAAFENPSLSAIQIRDLVREKLLRVGPGCEAISHLEDGIWQLLRPVLQERERRARHIVAISQSTHIDVSNEKATKFITGERRSAAEAMAAVDWLRRALGVQISERGDRRIESPEAVAREFMQEVVQESGGLIQGSVQGAIEQLASWGIDIKDIGPETLMGEIMDLGIFRQQMRGINSRLRLPWDRLVENVRPERVPCWLIVDSIRKHGQDVPERKGSDLNDSYLAVLSAYADFSFVDKRTNENLVRARRKDPVVTSLIRHADRYGLYFELLKSMRPHVGNV